jgi:hypothetical protein
VTVEFAIAVMSLLCALYVALSTERARPLVDAASLRWARLRGPDEELRAIGRALPEAGTDRRRVLYDRVCELADLRPDDVAEELATWTDLSLPRRVCDRVVAAWVRRAEPKRFPATWDALHTVLPGGSRRVAVAVFAWLRTTRPAPGFCLGAVAFLEERLSAKGRSSGTIDLDLELLERVLPPGHAGRIGIWQAVLGDAAAASGQPEVARSRWRLAVDAGVAAARPRLAHSYAVQGRELVLSGDPGAGASLYFEAYRLTDDLEYRLGELVALVVEHRVGRAALAAALTRLVPGIPEAALWAGIAHVAVGDLRAGAPLLRRAARELIGTRQQEAARLAQLAELDGDGLRALGRSLLDAHGREWARHCPFPPDRVVSAAADPAGTDAELLDGLLAGYPQTVQLWGPAREMAARAVLTTAVQHAEADIVLRRLELAERLLAEDA